MADRFLQAKEIGRTEYKEFVKEKLEGERSIWDRKKEKIATFVSNNKAFTVTINNETYQIKEERKLLNQLLVVSRTRPDLDLPTELEKYEFSVTPPSIFASDGTLNHEKKKSDIAVHLRNYQQPREEQENIQMSDVRKVIIFDAMAIVNKIDIKKNGMKNCLEFASNFMDIIDKQASGF